MSSPKFSPAALRRSEIWVVVLVGLFASGAGLAFAWAGWQTTLSLLTDLSPSLLAGLIFLALANYALSALRWFWLARRAGIATSFSRLLVIFMAGMAFIPTPGKAGTALRLWLLKRQDHIPYTRSAPVFLLMLLTEFLGAVLVAVIGAHLFTGVWPMLAIISLLGVGILLVFAWPSLLERCLNLADRLTGHRLGALWRTLALLLQNIRQLMTPLTFFTTLVIASIAWLLPGHALWWILQAWGYELSWLAVQFCFSFSMIIGAVSLLPGGLGSTEISLVALLSILGVPTPAAVAATALIRLVSLWLPVGIGLVTLPFALRLSPSTR
jgi:uncharacterized protein (TIRG00374 family)